MAPLYPQWHKTISLYLVTPLANSAGVYFGTSNGKVLRLDYWTGEVLNTSDLPGTGYHEVRLAAPPDASMLIAGTNGYVVALNPSSLDPLWTRSLPGTGYNVTDVLCAPDGVYAGCNGYVFPLDPSNDGHILNQPRNADSGEDWKRS